MLELLAVDLEKPVRVIVGHNRAASQGFSSKKSWLHVGLNRLLAPMAHITAPL